ncbi:type II secretion system protein [uncultured Desulfosarcina sp.]|uniref:type II secretion system protein n=1 Tax=uncultured Desulfosarcina sp. TaxID=218289 RepID=UPI0029C82E24|nr:type II secretion system protein [uncultured Desulfosarcina sp.]
MTTKTKRLFRNRSGFTLLEVLVVLTILGFVMAMASTRFGGITRESLATMTQQNMTDLINYITADLQRNGKYPSGMINIVSVDSSAGTYHKPMVSDRNPDNEPEVLGYDMDHRYRLFLHYLNESEAAELRSLGVVNIYNYNSPNDRNVATGSPFMDKVAAGVAVLMTGGGDADNDGTIVSAEVDTAESDRRHPDELFRILFGLGPETSLIKNGLVLNASTCPEP